MSSKRKRIPPVRVDEESKRRLEWNMMENRKNEAIQEDELTPDACSVPPDDTTPSSSFFSITEDVNEAACSRSVQFLEELPSTSSDSGSASLELSVLPASKLAHIWKALIGDFNIWAAWVPSDYEQRVFVLYRKGELLHISYSSCDESSEHEWEPDVGGSAAECSLFRISLEDLDWLQKRRVVQLCHQTKDQEVKVGAYFFKVNLQT